jgi:arylsulfatase A-like enzyme
MLPASNGFNQFLGNLYHLNAEEEPGNPDYPRSSSFKEQFGPRGVIRSSALPDGGQQIEDTGPLTRKRMETVDEEVTARRSPSWTRRTLRESRSSSGGTPPVCTSSPT